MKKITLIYDLESNMKLVGYFDKWNNCNMTKWEAM